MRFIDSFELCLCFVDPLFFCIVGLLVGYEHTTDHNPIQIFLKCEIYRRVSPELILSETKPSAFLRCRHCALSIVAGREMVKSIWTKYQKLFVT